MQPIRVLALTFVLAAVAFAQSDEESLRAIVGKYFDAYARKDWPAMQAMWHQSAPPRGDIFEIFQRQFADSELSFSDLVISRVKIESDKASFRVSTRRIAKPGKSNSMTMTDVRVEMSFVKDNGQWKLWNEISPVFGLLNALTEARTDEARRRLLDQESDLVTRELLFLLSSQSDRAYAQGNQARSLNLLQSQILVADRLNNRSELSDAWHKAGIIHFLQKRFDEAMAAYRRSLTIDEESGRKEEVARSLSSIALVFMTQSRFAESLDHFQRALAIYESLNRKQEVTRTIENIGNVYGEQGDYSTAITFYQRCVQLYDESKRVNEATHMVLKIARVEYEQGHDAPAASYFRQAADRFIAAGNRRDLGYAYHNLANIFYEQGDYNQALVFYQRSLQAEREAGTREGEAGALQGIGLVHSLNGNNTAALEAYRQNLALAQALQNKANTAVAWQKVGGSLYSLGRLDEAFEAYKQTLVLREQLGDGQETALALLDVGLTLAAKRQFSEALEHYFRSRELFERAGNPAGIAAVLLNAAQVHYLESNFVQVLEIASVAADFAKRANDNDLFWQARHRAGKAHLRLGDLASARKALIEAINTIESMRPQASRTQQPRFFETKIAPYLAMVDVALGEGKGNEAYNFSQRAKIRVLTGLLQNVKTQITKTMTGREQERERQLLGEISNFNLRLYREQERDKPNPARLAELKATLEKAQSDYASFRTRLYALRPALKILRGEIKPVTTEQAAALVRDTKTALLEFVETDERVYLFAFAKDAAKNVKSKASALPKIYVLDTTRGDLYSRLSRFNQSIASRDESVNAQARELYDLLLKQAQPSLAGKTQLVIAPDVISWGLPFGALRSDADRYLIEDFAVSYTPSLTILNATMNTRLAATAANRSGQSLALLAVVNPVLSQDAAERIKTALAAERVEPGTGGENEVAEFGKLYDSKKSLMLAGADATEDKVKSEIGKASVIHFATRGIHHEASPMFSMFALSPGAETQNAATKEDGVLELRELLRLNLKADLVVMEANEWAQPRTLTNRAMTAWAWAWFVAGSRSALLSQWRTGSTDLMIKFHRQLKTSRQSKAGAWRDAVKQLISREEFKHPYFWAGFGMLGK